ncbi:hypothetical protein [Micromonospora sp. NPDC049891]|uniref:hypothetical protein n=1 Tax=Micromonospora sp. NPDC049891 TaxID=3155655 RepID=UPI0033EB0481
MRCRRHLPERDGRRPGDCHAAHGAQAGDIVIVRCLPLEQARAEGALALFGEIYDATVRVVEIGGEWSRELCGGTHVDHSAQIGSLALTGESSVGGGQRRIEAVTGIEALR